MPGPRPPSPGSVPGFRPPPPGMSSAWLRRMAWAKDSMASATQGFTPVVTPRMASPSAPAGSGRGEGAGETREGGEGALRGGGGDGQLRRPSCGGGEG